MDLDQFKVVNDNHGHQRNPEQGRELQKFAGDRALSRQLQGGDNFTRQ